MKQIPAERTQQSRKEKNLVNRRNITAFTDAGWSTPTPDKRGGERWAKSLACSGGELVDDDIKEVDV